MRSGGHTLVVWAFELVKNIVIDNNIIIALSFHMISMNEKNVNSSTKINLPKLMKMSCVSDVMMCKGWLGLSCPLVLAGQQRSEINRGNHYPTIITTNQYHYIHSNQFKRKTDFEKEAISSYCISGPKSVLQQITDKRCRFVYLRPMDVIGSETSSLLPGLSVGRLVRCPTPMILGASIRFN